MTSKKEFVITDGKRFVKQNMSGKYAYTNNVSIADIWDAKEKAESVLFNSVPSSMRFSLYVAELKDGCVYGQEILSKKQVVECRKEVRTPIEKGYHLPKYSFDEDEDVQKMISGFESVKKVLSTFANNHHHKSLEERTQFMNWAVEDIKHYHGKKALNSRDGFRLNRLEDKAIIKRISMKNQLEVSKKLMKHYSSIISQIEDICSTIDELRNQKYIPRVLPDLFENDNLDIDIEDLISKY